MEIKGFDIYSFPSRPEVSYAIKDFEFKVSGEQFRVIVELLIRENCHRVLIKQGNAKKPNFLITNSAESLMKPIGAGVSKEIRKVLFAQPAGDVMEGCGEAVGDVSEVFGTVAVPAADVVARIPVIMSNYVEFENKVGNRRHVKRAVFELKPQHYGYVVATEHGLADMVKEFEAKLRAISP
jgi:hypothetical protein